MSHKKWWELYPRLEHEYQELDKAGIKYSIDKESFSKGVVRLKLPETIAGEVSVIFSDLYPYFRFEVYAPDITLEHHQNPFRKNLCMIGRATDNWEQDDTVAAFITKRLPQVLKAGASTSRDEVSTLEDHQAEPLTEYFICEPGTGIIMDGNWEINQTYKSGTIIIGLLSNNPRIQGAAFEIHDENNRIIVYSDNDLRKAFSSGIISARWIKLDRLPKASIPHDFFEYVSSRDVPNKITTFPVNEGRIQVRAALFPEERGHREIGQGWIFVCKYEKRQSVREEIKNRNNKRR